ncbi:MAG: helix-turn-helix domain-containing protein [Solirubrobacterales bacterium]|nr:helix-turn-helix domain-containing protein [Solirubrobacterales bacterium]
MAEMGSEIGETLRETRMRARIDIGEVEMRTKIRAKYLRAIENEEWDLLPGPVYVKSFLTTYADYLGLDSRLLVDEYKRQYELPSDGHARPLAAVKRETQRERERMARGPRGPLVPSWLLIAVVIVLACAGLWFFGKIGTSKSPKSVGETGTGGHHSHHVAKHKKRARPVSSGEATLALKATAAVWVCATNGSGKSVLHGKVLKAGGSVPVLRGRTILLSLGNESAKLTVNGKPYPLANTGTPTGLKVTPKGASHLSKRPVCA